MKRLLLTISILMLLLVTSCFSVKYSMSGASIPQGMKTISIQFFPNRAMIVQPSLSQQFTEALKEKMRSQTSLRMINDIADATFEGEITEYYAQPIAITGNDIASKNRLTITVRVKFTNAIDPKLSFDKPFSRYADYDSKNDLVQVENGLIKDIIDSLIEDIFNEAFAHW